MEIIVYIYVMYTCIYIYIYIHTYIHIMSMINMIIVSSSNTNIIICLPRTEAVCPRHVRVRLRHQPEPPSIWIIVYCNTLYVAI